jgi:hypothetical protein
VGCCSTTKQLRCGGHGYDVLVADIKRPGGRVRGVVVVRPLTELSGIASTVASFGMCRNENTRKLQSAFMANPTQTFESHVSRLFRDELSRLSLSLSPLARTCLKLVVLEGSDKDSG